MCNKTYLIMAVAFLVLVAAQAFAVGTLDYSNTQGYEHGWAPNPGYVMADDVHRTTNYPLVAVDLWIHNPTGTTTSDVDLYIYENTGDTALPVSPVIVYDNIGTVAPGDNQFVHYELPAPLAVSANLWIGIGSAAGTSNTGSLKIEWAYNTPTLGATHGYLAYGLTPPGNLTTSWVNDPGLASAQIKTYSQIPEPGSLLALGTGLVGLIGLATRRRR